MGLMGCIYLFLVLDSWTMTWVGLCCAFWAKNPRSARSVAGFLVVGVVWILFGLSSFVFRMFDLFPHGFDSIPFWAGLYLFLALAWDLALVNWARRWLRNPSRLYRGLVLEQKREEQLIPRSLTPSHWWGCKWLGGG